MVWGGWCVAAVVLALLLGLSGCGRHEPQARRGGPPVIVVSISPLASLTNYLVQDWADVRTLAPPGANPHGFELTASQLRSIADADLLIVVGMNLDPWAERAAREAGRKGLPILRFSDLVGKTKPAPGEPQVTADAHDDHDHEGHDHAHDDHDHAHGAPAAKPDAAATAAAAPAVAKDEHADHDHDHDHDHSGPNAHLWVDPVLAREFVGALAARIEPLFADKAQSLRMRANMAQSQIAKLDVAFRERLARVPVKELVTFHNAFDLLAERYGLKVIAHLTEIDIAPGGEVAPRQLIQTIEAVQKFDLKVIYAEPQFPDSAMNAVRQQTGVQVLRLDGHGHPGYAGHLDYIKLMEYNLETLVQGQSLTQRQTPTTSQPAASSP
jgi:zinc transport system substrate-binding protein